MVCPLANGSVGLGYIKRSVSIVETLIIVVRLEPCGFGLNLER
jgi:hypothetical protein